MLTVGRRGRPPPRLKDPVEMIRGDSPVLVGANVATSSNGVPGFHGVDATGPLAGDATTKGSFWPPAPPCSGSSSRRAGGPIGNRAHHPLAKAGGADTERQVEPAAQVLQGDHARQLHQLIVVEVLAQCAEQLVGDLNRSAAHPHRIVEDQLVEVAEELAVAIAREREQLLVAQSGTPGNSGADVDALE